MAPCPLHVSPTIYLAAEKTRLKQTFTKYAGIVRSIRQEHARLTDLAQATSGVQHRQLLTLCTELEDILETSMADTVDWLADYYRHHSVRGQDLFWRLLDWCYDALKTPEAQGPFAELVTQLKARLEDR
jgi:hypothetical protein